MANWTAHDIEDQSGRVAIVTGANSGIGYTAALELAKHGATVIVASRSAQRGQAAAEKIGAEKPAGTAEFMALDLADLQSIRDFAGELARRFDRLDLLINNAGVMMPPYSKTKDRFELQIGTNHLGHFALTGLLLDKLMATPSSRVVTVSSIAHRFGSMDFDDLHSERKAYNKSATYGQSKLANLLFTYELQRRLSAAGSQTIATAAHPGWTATNLQQHSAWIRWMNPIFGQTPERGALPTLFAAVAPAVQAGDYIGPNGLGEIRGAPRKVKSNAASHKTADAARLWKISEQATGVHYEGLALSAVA